MAGQYYATSQGLTTQERLKPTAMSKPLYNEDDWRTSVSNGTVDVYISALLDSDDINVDSFNSKYKLIDGDPSTRLNALYNEIGADRKTLKEYEIPVFDENGNYVYDENGKQMFEKVLSTEYDYNLKNISLANEAYKDSYNAQMKLKDRQNRSEFSKFLGDIGVVLSQGSVSILGGIEQLGGLIGATGEELFQEGKDLLFPVWADESKDKTFAERVNYWFTDLAMFDDVQKEVDKFAYHFSHFYTDEGEMTTVGKCIIGVIDTIGKMLPSMLIGCVVGATGASLISTSTVVGGSKVGSFLTSQAGTIGQLSFYAGNVFGRSVSDQYEYYSSQGITVSSSEIVANALVKTALQYGVEKGLGALLGGTGLDQMFWGTPSKIGRFRFGSKNLTLKSFGRLSVDMLQEGLEESLQETSDWFVDAAHHFINHDFQKTEWNWQNIWDAFAIASLTSIVGTSGRIVGQSVNRKIDTGSFGLKTGAYKVNKDGELIKNAKGEYEFVTLNPVAAYEYGLDLQSYFDNINNLQEAGRKLSNLHNDSNVDSKTLSKADSQFIAAYYQALGSFELLSSVYGEMGKERFTKANEILVKMREAQDNGLLSSELRSQAVREIIDGIPSLAESSVRKIVEAKLRDAEITKTKKSVKKNDVTDSKDNISNKAKKLIEELESVNEVVISEDGKMPVQIERILIVPENLLDNASHRVIIASIAEQKLADELASGVLSKAKYFNNEVSIITDLYRQWSSDENASEQDAIYNLIFDTRFFEVVLSLNEKITSSFVLRLNNLVDIVGKKQDLENSLLNKRIQECRQRWINAAYNFYSNNLDKDTSLFTKGLTATERKTFDDEIGKLLKLYNMGISIIKKPSEVNNQLWSFIDRRIDNMNINASVKENIKSDVRDKDIVKRQNAMDLINEYYDGAFYTLYNGNVYMPETSIGNCALNDWLRKNNLNLKTIFNSDYFTDEDIAELGENYNLEDVYAHRQLQFEEIYPSMSFNVYDNGNITVTVDGDESGFEFYAKTYNKERSNIITGKSFKIGDKDVERSIVTDIENISSWIKDYLRSSLVKDDVHKMLTIDEIINHYEYLNDSVLEAIENRYGRVDKSTVYRYLQNALTSSTDGKKSLVVKQDNTIVVGDMSVMNKVLLKDIKFPKSGVFGIDKFINKKYLTGVLGEIKVEFTTTRDTQYVDYDYDPNSNTLNLVNRIYINTNVYKSADELSFALCHEFQHAIQTENRLTLGTSNNILKHFTDKDKKAIIETVKELEPKLFQGITKQKDIEHNVNSYIYNASGEYQAMGLGSYGEIGFYPVIVSHHRGKTTIKFRNGKSFTVAMKTNPIIASRNIFDHSREMVSKFYTKYNFTPSIGVLNAQQYSRLKELASKKSIDLTSEECAEIMYCSMRPSMTFEEFKTSQVMGVELNGVKYALYNTSALERTITNIVNSTENDYKDDKVNFKIFTFMPKDLDLFKYQYGEQSGKIYINDSKLTNRRNLSVPLDKKANNISSQSLVAEYISNVTGEYVYDVDRLSELYEYEQHKYVDLFETGERPSIDLDIDEILEELLHKGIDIENMSAKDLYKFLSDDGDFSISENDLVKLLEFLKKESLTILPDIKKFESNDIAYKYFVQASEDAINLQGLGTALKFPEKSILSNEEKKELLNYIEAGGWRSKRLNSMYKLAKLNYEELTFDEFLNLEFPIARVQYNQTISDTPFLSSKILTSDSYGNVRSLLSHGDVKDARTLFLGKVKVKDVYFFSPYYFGEVLVSSDVFDKSVDIMSYDYPSIDVNNMLESKGYKRTKELLEKFDNNRNYIYQMYNSYGVVDSEFEELFEYVNDIDTAFGLRIDTILDLNDAVKMQNNEHISQSLDENSEFKISEQKEKAPAEATTKATSTEAEGKIIDKRPKSQRKKSFKYDSKKYREYTTPIVYSKNPTRVVSSKDIDADIKNTGMGFRRPRGGNYVYREFVERRYYVDSNGDTQYEDIFNYYTPRKEGSEGRRHTLSSEIKNSNLEYFTTKKGKRQLHSSPQFRDFVDASTGIKLDSKIESKIKSGTLKSVDLVDYIVLNDAKNIDNTTFHLICKYYFKNDKFKSPQEFDSIVNELGPKAMALNLVLKDTDLALSLKQDITSENINRIYEVISSNKEFGEKLSKELSKIEEGYMYRGSMKRSNKSTEGVDTELYFKIVKDRLLDTYDGTIESVGREMSIARQRVLRATDPNPDRRWQTRFTYSVKTSSLENTAARGKDGDELSVEDMQGEVDSFFESVTMTDYDVILRELSDVSLGVGRKVFYEIAKNILNSDADNKPLITQRAFANYKANIEKLSEEQVRTLYDSLLSDLDDNTIAKIYYLAQISNNNESFLTDNEYTRKNKFKEKAERIADASSKVQGIKRQVQTIKKYVSKPSEIRLLLRENSDIFDDKLNIKESSFKSEDGYKPYPEILKLKERISKISLEARNGVYESDSNYKYYKKSEVKRQKTLDEILKYASKSSKNIKFTMASIQTDEGPIKIKLKEEREIPSSIREVLAVGLTKTGTSKIQELAEYHERFNEDGSVDKVYDDRYLKLAMLPLLRENADLLNGLSEDEAIEILEFYISDNIIIADVDSQIVSETVRLVSAYILGECRHSEYRQGFDRFNIDESLIKRVEAKMMEQAHMSAAMLSNQRTIIKLLQPEKVIAQQLAKNLGFVLDEEDEANLDNMLTQMRVGTKESYHKAKEKFARKLIGEYDDKSKQSKIDKFLTFERAMMLSNPGTWVRNIASNYIVEGGNVASIKTGEFTANLFMKVFPKNKGKLDVEGQYKLGKKISLESSKEEVTYTNRKGEVKTKNKNIYRIKGGDISNDTAEYINDKFVNSGLLDEIIDGVSKYDDLGVRSSSSDDLIDMVARSIHSHIRRNQVFSESKHPRAGAFGNDVIKLIYKGLNDDPWIKRQTIKYFAQIVEEDYQRARLNANNKGKSLSYSEYLKDDKGNIYGVSKPIASAFVKAVNLASYDYMKSPNFISQIEKTLRNNVPKSAWLVYKQVFPFLASSWNWCVEGMRYTPAGLAVSITKLAKLENTISKMDKSHIEGKSIVGSEFAKYLQTRNIGKGVIGTLGFLIGGLLFDLGWAGLDEEDDEYKLIIGDVKINISDVLGSQGIILGIATAQNVKSSGQNIIDVISEVFDQLFKDSIFQDFIDTMRYSDGVGDFALNELGQIPLQIWPNVLKAISSIVHYRGVEYSNKPLEKYLQKSVLTMLPLPEESVGANVKVNPYTGKAESWLSGEFFEKLISKVSPIKVDTPHLSKNEAIAISLGVKKGSLTGRYNVNDNEVVLTSNEISKLNVLYGKLNKDSLSRFYSNSMKVRVKMADGSFKELTYSQMTKEQKRAATDNIMSNNSSIAKIYILTSSGRYKYYTTDSEYEKLKKLGITTNIYKKTKDKEGFVKVN